MRRVFEEGSKVRVFVGETLEEAQQELEDFMNDEDNKIIIDISHECVAYPISYKILLVYKEIPEFLEVEDVELETMREIYIAFNEEDID